MSHLKLSGIEVGMVCGRLTVAERAGSTRHGKALWRCACECGKTTTVRAASLKSGGTQSCGCYNKYILSTFPSRTTHGMCHTSEYSAFHAAKGRCNCPSKANYSYYGGRGIKFLFTSFEQFFAELGPKPSAAHTVDRINNNGHYEPGNVRWATKAQQSANRRCCKKPCQSERHDLPGTERAG